jgi:hypothetical protein
MPTVHAEVKLSAKELLEAVEQFSPAELEQFISQVIALQTKRRAPTLSKAETELLLKINQGLSPDEQDRYDELVGKLRGGTLADNEHTELITLTDRIEGLTLQRVECLVELAGIRGTTLDTLIEDLDIKPRGHG